MGLQQMGFLKRKSQRCCRRRKLTVVSRNSCRILIGSISPSTSMAFLFHWAVLVVIIPHGYVFLLTYLLCNVIYSELDARRRAGMHLFLLIIVPLNLMFFPFIVASDFGNFGKWWFFIVCRLFSQRRLLSQTEAVVSPKSSTGPKSPSALGWIERPCHSNEEYCHYYGWDCLFEYLFRI